MLRIIVLVTTFIVVNADSTLSGFSPSDDGLKTYDYGNRNADKYSTGSTKYFLASGSGPVHVNSLSSSYPSTIYSDASQGESLASQSVRNYQNVDNSYLSDAPTTISSYSRERPYTFSNSDYTSSVASQPNYAASGNSQSGFAGRTDYESSAPVSDYTGSQQQFGNTGTQQFTVGTSYRGSSVDNYPASQDASSIRGFVSQASPSSSSSSSSSSSPSTGFVASPSYPDTSASRLLYTGSGFKTFDTSAFRSYYPTSGTREFLTSAKHRGQIINGKYPIYENAASDGFSGNEVDYASSSPHVYSAGNYKREGFNSAGSPLHSGFSASGLNYLSSAGVKSAYPFAGLKPQSMIYSGAQKSPASLPVQFGGTGAHGNEGRIIVSGGTPNFAAYSASPSYLTKGHGTHILGNGSGKFIIMKDNSSGSSHLGGSAYPAGQMYSANPLIGGNFKTTRNADYGNQAASFSYTPSFAGGSSPYTSRYVTRGGGGGGGNPFSSFFGAS